MKNIAGIFLFFILVSCTHSGKNNECIEEKKADVLKNKSEFITTMKVHLDAVTNRDLETLRSTLSPDGDMQLILPSSEIIEGVNGFMNYHKDWFALPNWTFETRIVSTDVGEIMGMAIAEVVYKEPERNGLPYFNRMSVSYDLKKVNGKWVVIKDHASSIEKSTDKKQGK